MTLPLLTHELMRRGTGERAIGTIYSANTLGAIVGVLLTIHVLMPLIGVKGVILAGAGIHLALGLSRLLARWSPPIADLAVVAMAAAIGVFGLIAVFVMIWIPCRWSPASIARDSRAAGRRQRRLSAGRQDCHDQSGGAVRPA